TSSSTNLEGEADLDPRIECCHETSMQSFTLCLGRWRILAIFVFGLGVSHVRSKMAQTEIDSKRERNRFTDPTPTEAAVTGHTFRRQIVIKLAVFNQAVP